MKLNAITYDDNQEIEAITVTMTLTEATALHALAGRLNDFANRRLGLVIYGEDLRECIDRVFCWHYDNGRPDGFYPRITLETLNTPITEETP